MTDRWQAKGKYKRILGFKFYIRGYQIRSVSIDAPFGIPFRYKIWQKGGRS